MKRTIRHITVFLLTGIVFLSTTGLSIHKIYCYCKGESKTSLFYFAGGCEKMEQAHKGDCCKERFCPAAAEHEKRPCKNHSAQYFKLDAKYVLFSSDFEINYPAIPPLSNMLKIWLPSLEQPEALWANESPPSPSGKDRLPWLQTFIC